MNLNRICSSTLERAVQTAEIIAKRLNLKVEAEDSYTPWDLGPDIVGKTFEEAKPLLEKLLSHKNRKPEGGESYNEWKNRFLPALDEEYESKDNVLIVTHSRNLELLDNSLLEDKVKSLQLWQIYKDNEKWLHHHINNFVEFPDKDFVHRYNVAIFTEDMDWDEDGLQKIIDINNYEEVNTGDPISICIGHTDKSKPLEQKEVIGFASNLKMGMLGNIDPKKTIYADYHIYKEKEQELKKYPKRSIEIYPQGRIANISILGSGTPKKSLALAYEKNNDTTTYYMQQDQEEVLKYVLEALDNLDWVQKIKQTMKNTDDKDKYEQDSENEENDMSDKNENVEKKPEADVEKKDELVQHEELAQERRKYQRLMEDYSSMKTEITELKQYARNAEHKAELLAVEQEGVLFEMVEELNMTKDMDKDAFTSHVERMKKRYQRSPIGVNIKPMRQPAYDTEDPTISQDRSKGWEVFEALKNGKAKSGLEVLGGR